MGSRIEKFRELNGIAVDLKMSAADRYKLLLSTYLRRLKDRIPGIPEVTFKLKFQFNSVPVIVYIRSNDVDFRHLGGLFVRREYDVPLTKPRRILDLGGNIGTADIVFHALYPEARIIALEPVPDNLRVLRMNWLANRIQGEIVPAAVSDKPGKAQFFLGEADCSSLVHQSWMPGDSIEVECLTVPQIMERAGWDEIDILKVDIEGGEKALFKDSAGWIEKAAVIIGELHDGYSVEELDRDLGGRFVCTQAFEYHTEGRMKGFLAVRKSASAPFEIAHKTPVSI